MTDSQRNAAVWYVADSFDASGRKLPIVGRTAAGEGFLKALANHAGLERLYCFTGSQAGYEAFQSQIRRLSSQPPKTGMIPWQDPARLTTPGCLYVPEPALEKHAWNRRSLGDQRAYSLCGVTHTTAHHETVDHIGALLTAPLQSWDALICTSRVVHATVTRLLDDRADYLKERGAGRIECRPQLPVIPLGIDTRQFAESPQTQQARRDLRQQIKAGKDDIVALYLGRLSVNIKTNPYSMLASLSRAAKQTGRKVHLIIAGWFQDNVNAGAFQEGVQTLCPNVNVVLMDGRQDAIRRFAWFAADIFVSLIDNIQETFGISPIEAMAAGLPVVVSDWNGYRDNVIDGETGFRIPTVFPEPGAGEEIALRYNAGLDSYETYLAHCAAATVIDENACTDALARLITDSELRARMGAAGRRHVQANFDWKTVIHRYQDLWEELARRRAGDSESVPPRPGVAAAPLRQDPFRLFAEYPTQTLGAATQLGIAADTGGRKLENLYNSSLFTMAVPLLLSENDCRRILQLVRDRQSVSVDEVEKHMDGADRQRLYRSLAWLAKTGLIRIADIDYPVA